LGYEITRDNGDNIKGFYRFGLMKNQTNLLNLVEYN